MAWVNWYERRGSWLRKKLSAKKRMQSKHGLDVQHQDWKQRSREGAKRLGDRNIKVCGLRENRLECISGKGIDVKAFPNGYGSETDEFGGIIGRRALDDSGGEA